MLRELVDEHEEKESEHDTLPERVGDHVECLVVDSVKFLQTLQVIEPSGRVGNRPQAQVVHMAK